MLAVFYMSLRTGLPSRFLGLGIRVSRTSLRYPTSVALERSLHRRVRAEHLQGVKLELGPRRIAPVVRGIAPSRRPELRLRRPQLAMSLE